VFDLPAELAELLYTYLGEPRRALLDHHLLNGQSCPYVFMDMHGRGFAGAVLTLYSIIQFGRSGWSCKEVSV